MLLGQYECFMLQTVWGGRGLSVDVSRFGAQVINGIGFLGAGTVIVTGKQQVKGLTTAAGLWASACMGLAVGAGFYEGGVVATFLVLSAELLFSRLEYHILHNAPEVNLYMEYANRDCLDRILDYYRNNGVKVLGMQITGTKNENHNASVIFTLHLNKYCNMQKLSGELQAMDEVFLIEEL